MKKNLHHGIVCLLFFSLFASSCATRKKLSKTRFAPESEDINWKELSGRTPPVKIGRETNQVREDEFYHASRSYILNLNRSIPFEKVVWFRNGYLAQTKDRGYFYIGPKDNFTSRVDVEGVAVAMMSQYLSCFMRQKLEIENVLAYRCKDGRIVKFVNNEKNELMQITARAYNGVKLEWIALESTIGMKY